jgi:hypothetical protein
MTLTYDIDYLIEDLRLFIGDTNPLTYRYTDTWLDTALLASVKALGRWWANRYMVDNNELIYRNTNYTLWEETSPPVIQQKDERPIILMAAIVVLEGSLENMAWDLASWKDNEISYTNLESGKIKNERIKRLWTELESLMLPPTKRLAWTTKQSLPGYVGNNYERQGKL